MICFQMIRNSYIRVKFMGFIKELAYFTEENEELYETLKPIADEHGEDKLEKIINYGKKVRAAVPAYKACKACLDVIVKSPEIIKEVGFEGYEVIASYCVENAQDDGMTQNVLTNGAVVLSVTGKDKFGKILVNSRATLSDYSYLISKIYSPDCLVRKILKKDEDLKAAKAAIKIAEESTNFNLTTRTIHNLVNGYKDGRKVLCKIADKLSLEKMGRESIEDLLMLSPAMIREKGEDYFNKFLNVVEYCNDLDLADTMISSYIRKQSTITLPTSDVIYQKAKKSSKAKSNSTKKDELFCICCGDLLDGYGICNNCD